MQTVLPGLLACMHVCNTVLMLHKANQSGPPLRQCPKSCPMLGRQSTTPNKSHVGHIADARVLCVRGSATSRERKGSFTPGDAQDEEDSSGLNTCSAQCLVSHSCPISVFVRLQRRTLRCSTFSASSISGSSSTTLWSLTATSRYVVLPASPHPILHAYACMHVSDVILHVQLVRLAASAVNQVQAYEEFCLEQGLEIPESYTASVCPCFDVHLDDR